MVWINSNFGGLAYRETHEQYEKSGLEFRLVEQDVQDALVVSVMPMQVRSRQGLFVVNLYWVLHPQPRPPSHVVPSGFVLFTCRCLIVNRHMFNYQSGRVRRDRKQRWRLWTRRQYQRRHRCRTTPGRAEAPWRRRNSSRGNWR